MINLKELLNSNQYKAVTTIDGPILVIAGAGSGKTRVIEYRVMYMAQNHIDPKSILLLTFTRRAAHEMLSRACKHEPKCSQVNGGTFHSFAYKLLKRYSKQLGFENSFTILEEGESEEAIHNCCARLNYLKKEKRFPKKDTLRAIISMSINKNSPIKDILEKEYPHFSDYGTEVENIRQKYIEYKLNSNSLDYDDLLVYLRILLTDNKEIRERLAAQYKYIMVDEYQDTNFLQGDITFLLGEAHKNIMVVGDDAQSIYGFRGACHTNIMAFPDKFPGCQIIKLEDNYRSTQTILDVANSVLANMQNRYSKCLIATKKETGDKPKLLQFKNTYDEAEWITRRIKDLRDDGVALHHQAVLYRSAYISIPLQAELSKRNIPYQVYGGRKFYETAHVRDALSHLKIMVNPRNELAWHRALTLIKGIGPKNAERIFGQISAASDVKGILSKAGELCKDNKSRFANDLRKLILVLDETSKSKDVGEAFEIILEYYTPILKRIYDDWNSRINDLEALSEIAGRYNSLEELLADFAIESPERGTREVKPELPDEELPLTMSTIHSAKGLEWDTVFIIGMTDGILPSKFSLDDVNEVEEEHRLFYVAVTRAKNRLFLSLHHEGFEQGLTQFNKISRFLDEPNIISKLQRKGLSLGSDDETTEQNKTTDDRILRGYNKKELLRRIDEMLKH